MRRSGEKDDDQARDASDRDEDVGARAPTRFAADVSYRGHVRGHDYVVEARHRLLDTTASITIDGVAHDAKAEKKAAGQDDAADVVSPDSLAVRLDEGLRRHRYTVRRPTETGTMKDREVVEVRTAGLGGTGEVDVRASLGALGAPLVPEEGSPSAARERRKAEHPVRFGMLAALAASARFLVPLLGIGAILAGLLRPVREWFMALLRPVLVWVDETTLPPRQWVHRLLEPVLSWIDRLLQPLRDARDWLWEILFGWIPEISIDLPDWVFDVAVPILVVVVAFVATYAGIRRRRHRMEQAKRPPPPPEPPAGERDPERPVGSPPPEPPAGEDHPER